MSGPPPCTTTGFIQTYFSSTKSRANSSRSSGSTIAAPPYLMTTVRPWNSRMYGSASSSVPTSRISAGLRSGRVFGIDRHVFVSQIGEEDLGVGARVGGSDRDLEVDLVALDRSLQRGRVMGDAGAARAHRDALDRDVDRQRRAARQGRADCLDDAAPVGVGAVQRGLDE